MADIHILAGDGKKHWRVAFHLDVPDQDNDVGVNYRTALVNSGLIAGSVLTVGDGGEGTITSGERDQIANGERWEHLAAIRTDTHGQTPASQVTALRIAYAKVQTDVLYTLQRQLKYFGHTESR